MRESERVRDVCVCADVRICMHACVYAGVIVCMHACVHVCMYAWVPVCMYACATISHVRTSTTTRLGGDVKRRWGISRAVFARIRRLRKSPQYLLAILHWNKSLSANLRNAPQNLHQKCADKYQTLAHETP